METNKIILYTDAYECIRMCTDEQKGKILENIFNKKIVRDDDLVVVTASSFILAQIKRNDDLYLQKCEKNREIANKRWGKEKDANVYERIRTHTNVCNPNPNPNPKKKEDIYSKISNKKTIPSIQEIELEIQNKDYVVVAEDFFNFYESKGWLVGKSPMKNWKAALSGWNSRSNKNKKEETGYVA